MGGAGVGEGDGEWVVGEARLSIVQSMAEEGWEALVLVCCPDVAPPKELAGAVDAHFCLDKASQEVRWRLGLTKDCVTQAASANTFYMCLQAGAVSVVQCEAVAGGRLVLASTGALGPYDDVRCVEQVFFFL